MTPASLGNAFLIAAIMGVTFLTVVTVFVVLGMF